MAIILIMADILMQQPSALSTVATTAVLILLYNPYIICDVGFILSFGGTIGIILLNKPITEWFNKKFFLLKDNKIFEYILEMLTVTLSAQIILTPVMWYYFNNISLISIITNLLVGPFTGIITILGLIVYFLSLIFFSLGKICSYSVYILISIIIFISQICAKVPFGNLTLPTPSLLFIITYYLIVYVIFRKKIKFIESPLNSLKRKIVNILVSILIILQIFISIVPQNYIEVNMIDVGQGDSCLIKTNNYNILIDGGGSENSDYDVGNSILVPYLLDNTNGIIDLMVISHFHEDHAEGCIAVLENLKVRKILIGTQPKQTELYDKVLKISKEKSIPTIKVVEGDTISMDNLKFEVLYPNEEIQIPEDLNNNSLVMKMDYYETSMLFTGDIEKEAENILVSESTDKLDIDILKVAHHGSKTSSINEFLQYVTPQIALISLSEDNKFGHPNEEVLNRINSNKCMIFRTDESGEISLKIYKSGKVKINKNV